MAQTSKSSSKSSSKARNVDARARAQAKREEIARAERRRRLGFAGMWGTLGLVVVLIVVLVVVFTVGRKNDTKNVNAAAPASLVSALATVPASTFASVGTSGLGTRVVGLKTVSGGSPILTDGKPTLVYVGGEFCPYCAAERWALVVALDRFGSFSGLQTTRSAANDGNYATLTFVDATYTSQYVDFDGKEIFDRARNDLQTLDAQAQASYQKFGQVGSVPFISINNQFTTAVQFDAGDLGSLTADEIAAQINAGQTQLAKDVISTANVLTAGICAATNDAPSAVCTAPEITAAVKAGALNANTGGSTSSGG